MDVANQGDIQQRFRFDPEVFAAFSFTLCIGDEDVDKLQNVFL